MDVKASEAAIFIRRFVEQDGNLTWADYLGGGHPLEKDA